MNVLKIDLLIRAGRSYVTWPYKLSVLRGFTKELRTLRMDVSISIFYCLMMDSSPVSSYRRHKTLLLWCNRDFDPATYTLVQAIINQGQMIVF